MSEFGGLPLVAGHVRGVRAFDVDLLGRLRGVTHAQVWTPGENQAECKLPVYSDEEWEAKVQQLVDLRSMGGPRYHFPSRPSGRKESDPHSLASAECGCGFYAYTEAGKGQYEAQGRVTAVIDGYGETTIGDKGFRCSKARIVALCVEPPEPEPEPDEDPEPVKRPSYRKPILSGIGALFAVAAIALGFLGGSWIASGLGGFALVVNLFLAAWTWPDEKYDSWFDHSIGGRVSAGGLTVLHVNPGGLVTDPGREVNTDLIRRNYPDVPFYTSRDDMLADFPVDRSEIALPTPDNDPDFWTRSA